ncbi:MAG: hypothetical protein PHW60_13525 [Kiritimatiellae bacterium]|nr:hypothetical protein [Kiritimatiellia bacterium]
MNSNVDNEFVDSWLQTIAIVFTMLVLFAGFYISAYFPEKAVYTNLFLAERQGAIRPEALERFIYLAGICWVTILPITLYWMYRRLFTKRMSTRPGRQFFSTGRLLKDLLPALLFAGWLYLLAQNTQIPLTKIYLAIAAGAALVLLALSRILYDININKFVLGAIAGIIAGFYSYLLVIPHEMIANNGYVSHHYEPVLAAVNQVVHGKTILVDSTSLYGVLHPYMAAAVFKWCPLTVFSLSMFFGMLAWLSFFFIYLAFCERTGYGSIYTLVFFLAAIGFMHPIYLTLLMFDQLKVPLIGAYYQYLPLRVLWGSFFIWYVSCHLRHAGRIPAWVGYMLAGISVLWNPDTGLVIMAAWAGMLVLHAAATQDAVRFKSTAKIVGRNIGAVILTLGAAMIFYSLFAWFRSGNWPDWGRFFSYQNIYYRCGYFMLPMKPLEFWQPILLMYSVSFFYGVKCLLRRDNTDNACWYCYVALFGLGIFSYYQGRSHYQCLVAVAYPAIILAGSMFVDLLKQQLNPGFFAGRREIFLKMAMLAIFIAWGIVYTVGSIPIAARYFQQLNQSLRTSRSSAPVDPDNELAPYLKANSGSIIISDSSTYLLTKYHCYSAFPVASLAMETYLKDQLPLIQNAIDSQSSEYLIIEKRNSMWFGYLSFDAYREIAQTPKFRILQAKRYAK